MVTVSPKWHLFSKKWVQYTLLHTKTAVSLEIPFRNGLFRNSYFCLNSKIFGVNRSIKFKKVTIVQIRPFNPKMFKNFRKSKLEKNVPSVTVWILGILGSRRGRRYSLESQTLGMFLFPSG